jgi:hypothetical protein
MGQGLTKNHKKYRNDFCSANNCKKCLIVEINFFFAKMSSSFGLWVSQCEFLIKVLSRMNFKRIMFFTFLRNQRGIPKEILIIGFPKAAFLKTVVYYKQDFFRQNQFAPCAGTRVTTLKDFKHFYSKIFLVGSQTSGPPFF